MVQDSNYHVVYSLALLNMWFVHTCLNSLTGSLSTQGSKRKNTRGDGQESKRLRSSGHSTRQHMKRGGPSSGANGKKLSNPRGRHLSEEFYDDRKSHGVRGSASRGDPLKGHSDKPLTRSRDAQRRIKPLMPELSEVRVQDECWHSVLY